MHVRFQDYSQFEWLRLFSKTASGLVVIMASLVLFGWLLGLRPLIRILPTLVAMNPVTALLFIFSGLALRRLTRPKPVPAGKLDIELILLIILVVTASLLRLWDYCFGLPFHVQQFLFAQKSAPSGLYPANELAPNTALCFLLCGIAILLLDLEGGWIFFAAQSAVLLAGLLALLALVGYSYRVLVLYRLGESQPMALVTALSFALLCMGALAARPQIGLMQVITSSTTGGSVARRLLPGAILLPWGLGALLLMREQAGQYSSEYAMAFFAVTCIVIFGGLVWWNAFLLYRADLERVRAEEQLRQAGANLERSNTDLQQFAYVASHDLTEPLRMVISYLQLLSQRHSASLEPQAKEFITFAVDGAMRMQGLIQDLLAYSRVEMRGRSPEPTDTQQVLHSALANLKVAIEETGAIITTAPLPQVQADRVQLTQVFQNLIANALKFHGSAPPRVEIGAEKRDGYWLLSVRDNGIGIDPKNAERIFVIFQRLHTRQEYPGTGIGLAICKKIIERHGGRIWVESTPGQGATFYFTLPALPP